MPAREIVESPLTTGAGSIISAIQSSGIEVYLAAPVGTQADGTSAYTAATQVTVTGIPFTFTEHNLVGIVQISAGGVNVLLEREQWSVAAGVITVSGAAFDPADTFLVFMTGPRKAHDEPSDTIKTSVSSRYENPDVKEEWYEATDAVPGSAPFFTMVDLLGWRHHAYQCVIDDGVVNVYYSADPDASEPADGGAAGSEWMVDGDVSPLPSTGGFIRPEEGAVAMLLEWTPNDATSDIRITGCRWC